MSPIVLDIKLAEKNVVKELGVYIDGQVFGIPLNRPKTINQHIKHSRVPKTCTKLIGKVAHWTIAVSTPC